MKDNPLMRWFLEGMTQRLKRKKHPLNVLLMSWILDVVTDFLILSLEIKINYILYLVLKGTVIFEYVIFDSILTLHFFHSFQIHWTFDSTDPTPCWSVASQYLRRKALPDVWRCFASICDWKKSSGSVQLPIASNCHLSLFTNRKWSMNNIYKHDVCRVPSGQSTPGFLFQHKCERKAIRHWSLCCFCSVDNFWLKVLVSA